MKRFCSMVAALLLCSAGADAQYTNILENGTNQTVNTAWTNDTIWVGQTTSSNTLSVVSGGAVFSTNVFVGSGSNANDNVISVTGGNLTVDDTLQIGSGTSNSVSVSDNGRITAGDLVILSGNDFNLNDGGTFAISTNFDASVSGFNWNDGGHLSVGGNLTGMPAAGSTNYLDGGRDLTLDGGSWDLAGNNLVVGWNSSNSVLTVQNSGQLSSADAFIGGGTNAAGNDVVIKAGGQWNNSGDLWVGFSGDNNTLSISATGVVDVTGSAFIGNVDASQNSVDVTGSNSVWTIGDDLLVGGSSNSLNNSLSVSGGGLVQVDGKLTINSGNSISLDTDGAVSVGSAMTVYSNATVAGSGTIDFGAADATLAFEGGFITLSTGIVFNANSNFANAVSVVDGTFTATGTNGLPYVNFQTLTLSNSTLGGSGLLDPFDAVTLTDGLIDPAGDSAGRLELPGTVTLDGMAYRADIINNEWDELVFSGPGTVDLTNLSLSVFVPFTPTTTNDIIILSATALTNSFSQTNLDVRPLLYGGQLLVTDSGVQVQLVPVDPDTLSSTLGYAATESVRAGFNGMKNMVFTRTKQLRRNLVATASAIPNEVRLLTTTNAPAGAYGPGDQNSIFDMHIWVQHYTGKGDYDRIGVSDAFSLVNNGTTIGMDKLIGDGLTAGFNYTYARSGARASNGDLLDAETYWFGAYGEWVGVDGLYLDAIAGYGFAGYDSERFAENYRGSASYNGHALGAAADLGQYYYYGDNIALSPYLGFEFLTLMNESYSETEDEGSVIRVDEVDHSWLISALGLKLRHRFDSPVGRFQTTAFAEWSYDFIQDEVYSSLASDGLPKVQTARILPDESGSHVGIGLSWFSTDYMEVGVGYNGRFSDSYEEHAATVMFDIMF
jgi:outer membrane autotransporter protein